MGVYVKRPLPAEGLEIAPSLFLRVLWGQPACVTRASVRTLPSASRSAGRSAKNNARPQSGSSNSSSL